MTGSESAPKEHRTLEQIKLFRMQHRISSSGSILLGQDRGNAGEIPLDVGPVLGLMQRRRRVKHRQDHLIPNPGGNAVYLGDARPGQKSGHRVASQRDDEPWLDQLHLLVQEWPAGFDVVGGGESHVHGGIVALRQRKGKGQMLLGLPGRRWGKCVHGYRSSRFREPAALAAKPRRFTEPARAKYTGTT